MNFLFYNAHQHGDIILSRQGVRWIIDHLGDNHNYYYLHGKNPESVFIHEKIKFFIPDFKFHSIRMENVKSSFRNHEILKDFVWIDTWVASLDKTLEVLNENKEQRWILPDENNNYILGKSEEVWDSVEFQKRLWKQNIDIIHNEMILNFCNVKIPYPDTQDLIPKWNGNPKFKKELDQFVDTLSQYEVRVFVHNSQVFSGQRKNIEYENILKDYIIKHKNVAFIFSDNILNLNSQNVYYIDNLFPQPNLNHIEYIGKFCDVLITSMSGPGDMVLNDQTWFDPSKTLIYVTRKIIGLFFDQGTCKYIQTDNFENENIYKIITDSINEKLLKL